MHIENIRKEYRRESLNKQSAGIDPAGIFKKWLDEAIISEIPEPTAMVLSTTGPDGFPQLRVVLLKSFTEEGFVFFTNYKSQKGKAIEKNPKVSLLFFWPELERQVRITGLVEKIPADISEQYFASRPVESRIGAWASSQSNEIPSRTILDEKFSYYQQLYKGKEIPMPENWGGYLVKPLKVEFWQGRENRLHDRIEFHLQNNDWIKCRLAP